MEVIGLKWTNVDRIEPKWTEWTEYTEHDQIGSNRTEVDRMDHIGPKQNQSGQNRLNRIKWTEVN